MCRVKGEMRDAGYEMGDAGCGMRDAGCGMRDAECGMRIVIEPGEADLSLFIAHQGGPRASVWPSGLICRPTTSLLTCKAIVSPTSNSTYHTLTISL